MLSPHFDKIRDGSIGSAVSKVPESQLHLWVRCQDHTGAMGLASLGPMYGFGTLSSFRPAISVWLPASPM